MNTKLYLGKIPEHERDEPFKCHDCNEEHATKGTYWRSGHRLLVLCLPEFTPIADEYLLQPTPAELRTIAQQPTSDGGHGIVVRCEHQATEEDCAGKQLYRDQHALDVQLTTGGLSAT